MNIPQSAAVAILVFGLVPQIAMAEKPDGFLLVDCDCKSIDGSKSCAIVPGQTWIAQIDPIRKTYTTVIRRADGSLGVMPGPPSAWQCAFTGNRFDCSYSESNGDYYQVTLGNGHYVDKGMILKNGKREVTVSQECKAKPAVVPK